MPAVLMIEAFLRVRRQSTLGSYFRPQMSSLEPLLCSRAAWIRIKGRMPLLFPFARITVDQCSVDEVVRTASGRITTCNGRYHYEMDEK